MNTELNKISDFSTLHPDVNECLIEMFGEDFREYRKRWELAEKQLHIFDFPLFLVIETVNTCNLKCIMCFRHEMPKQKTSVMSMELYERILSEAFNYNCPSLSLNWNNEPLLDPYLPERISIAKKYGFFDIRINTNANLLSPEKAEQLIDAGLTRLSASIDAVTAEAYAKIRIGGDYNKVVSNLTNFLDIRNRKGAKLPLLRCTFVRIRENEDELAAFIKFWDGKADYSSIQSYIPHTPKEWALELHPNDKSSMTNVTCSQPFERLAISVDGKVYPCCSPIGTEILLGNVHDSSLYEIWHRETESKLRMMMKHRTWNKFPVCRQCLENTFNIQQ